MSIAQSARPAKPTQQQKDEARRVYALARLVAEEFAGEHRPERGTAYLTAADDRLTVRSAVLALDVRVTLSDGSLVLLVKGGEPVVFRPGAWVGHVEDLAAGAKTQRDSREAGQLVALDDAVKANWRPVDDAALFAESEAAS